GPFRHPEGVLRSQAAEPLFRPLKYTPRRSQTAFLGHIGGHGEAARTRWMGFSRHRRFKIHTLVNLTFARGPQATDPELPFAEGSALEPALAIATSAGRSPRSPIR